MRRLVAFAAVVLLAAAGALVVDRDGEGDPGAHAARADEPAGLVRFHDRRVGFSIGIPRGWRRLRSRDKTVRLVAAGERGASLLVRAVRLNGPVAPSDTALMRRLTEPVVESTEDVRPVSPPRRVEVGGLPGLLHLYTFRDAGSRRRGVHSHFFLFRGDRMLSIVLQAVPERRFAELAPVFDRITASFRYGAQ